MLVSSNPIMDAEQYQMQGQERDYISCGICGGPIYREDATHYGDDVYNLDGLKICEGCISDYIHSCKTELK